MANIRELAVRIERAWALDAVEFADILRSQDPTWGSETFELADGYVVLCGPGLYVNRALAVGLSETITDDQFDVLERRSAVVGVPPGIEISDVTISAVRQDAIDRGFRPAGTVSALVQSIEFPLDTSPDAGADPDCADRTILVESVTSEQLLREWQETSAVGWGHVLSEPRRASDAFAQAAWAVDGRGMVIARSTDDHRALGCASLTCRDDIATLGGMSTVPGERRRGVQRALVRHRLLLARDAGCEIATSTAAAGGDSERNLMRCGFTRAYSKVTFVRD